MEGSPAVLAAVRCFIVTLGTASDRMARRMRLWVARDTERSFDRSTLLVFKYKLSAQPSTSSLASSTSSSCAIRSLCFAFTFESGYSFIQHSLLFTSNHYDTQIVTHIITQIVNMKSTLIIASLIAATLSAPTFLPSWRRQAGGNFQPFTGALGGIAATPVTDSGIANRQFQVKGDTFVNIGAALARSCDQQFNACANAANGGDATLSVSQCSAQKGTSRKTGRNAS